MNNNKSKRGSITILIIYIFVIVSVLSSILIHFALLQSSLSKNQLKKTQDKYNTENYLNKIIYDDNFVDDYLRDEVYKIYRIGYDDDNYQLDVSLNGDSRFDGNINRSKLKIKNMYGKPHLEITLTFKYDKIKRSLIAYGPCINDIYSTGKCLLEEDKLSKQDKILFGEFIDMLEDKNLDYNYEYNEESNQKLNTRAILAREEENLTIKLGDYRENKNEMYSEKILASIREDEKEGEARIQILDYFKTQNLILDLRRCNNNIGKTLTIGSRDEEGLIKMRGALYLEADLIINQDFEFQGIIVINDGSIIVNTDKKPKIEGMVFLRGEPVDTSKLEFKYSEKHVYRAGSYFPDYFDLKIDTIKSYSY